MSEAVPGDSSIDDDPEPVYEFENYVDGESGSISSSTYDVTSPFDERYRTRLKDSNLADIPRALSAAENALDETKEMDYEDRKDILREAQEMLEFTEEDKEYFVKMTGMPKKSVEFKIDFAHKTLEAIVASAEQNYDEVLGEIGEEKVPGSYEIYKAGERPASVFLPANDPSVAAYLLGNAVLTGSSMVVRPSSEEAVSSLRTAEALDEAGYPDGGLNVVLYDSGGDNESHRENMIGSCAACVAFGDDETVQSFEGLLPDSGNENFVGFGEGRANAYVFEDADLEKTVDSIVEGMTLWPIGCNATKAVRVDPAVYDEFREMLAQRLDEELTVGDPLDDETDVGYVDTETIEFLQDRVSKRVVSSGADELVYPQDDVTLDDGVDIVEKRDDDGDPVQMKPVVVETTTENSEFMHEEYPGYVLAISPVETDELRDRYREAYTEKGHKPITFSFYTEDPDEEKLELVNDLPAYQNNHNKSTIHIDPFLRHQGKDIVSELTRTEGMTLDEELDTGDDDMAWWSGVVDRLRRTFSPYK